MKTRRFHTFAAVALVCLLATVAYAAVTQTIKGSLVIKGPSLTVTDPTVAARTFSIDIDDTSTDLRIKGAGGSPDIVLSSTESEGSSVEAELLMASSIVIENYDATEGTGRTLQKYTQTLSGGTVTAAFTPAGSAIHSCSPPAYAQSTVRSFAINIGYVPNTRTYTIKLGGGGTTNDTVTGTCLLEGPVGAG